MTVVNRFTGFAIRATSTQAIVSVIYIFLFSPDSSFIKHLKFSCGVDWPYCALEVFQFLQLKGFVSMEMVDFAVFVLFKTTNLHFLGKNVSSIFLKVTIILAFLTASHHIFFLDQNRINVSLKYSCQINFSNIIRCYKTVPNCSSATILKADLVGSKHATCSTGTM